jgi:Leucine-rich repeat (LRR) protein
MVNKTVFRKYFLSALAVLSLLGATACPRASRDDASTVASGSASAHVTASSPSSTARADASVALPENERVKCTGTSCEVGTLSAAAKAELEKHASITSISLRQDATQEDLEALGSASLPSLHSFYVFKAPKIKDLTPLARHKGLRSIQMTDTGVTSLAPLIGLDALELVSIGTNANRSDPWPVDNSPKTPGAADPTSVFGFETPGSATEVDIQAIASIKSLRTVVLRGITVKNLEPLRGTGITSVALSQMHVDDVEPISTLPNLTDLTIEATSIPSFAWIGKIPTLRHLTLTKVRLKSLDFVAPLVELTSLDATANPELKSIAPLAKLTKLSLLYLQMTMVEDLGPLANMPKLASLTVSNTRVKTLAPLTKLTELTMVQAGETTVHDLKPLHASTNLTFVVVPRLCPDSEIDALKKVAPKVKVSH